MQKSHLRLGILGGGQLGRMTAICAARLGHSVTIFDPNGAKSPAGQVASSVQGAFTDNNALTEFADKVDIITYEFENIPLETVIFLNQLKPVHPKPELLKIAQNRIEEKGFFNRNQIPTNRWKAIQTHDQLAPALADFNGHAILKTARMGYDGHGQTRLSPDSNLDDLKPLFADKTEFIMEEIIDLALEGSVIIAKGVGGQRCLFEAVENRHKNHILDETHVPGLLSQDHRDKIIQAGEKIADALDFKGLLTVEFFIDQENELIANEMAPRPHNSGHWTIEGAKTSQFEQLVRAVMGYDLGSTNRLFPNVMMKNLLGDDILMADYWMKNDNAYLHLYGKEGMKTGRKMGHVTIIHPDRIIKSDNYKAHKGT